jgi:hypothetical protein
MQNYIKEISKETERLREKLAIIKEQIESNCNIIVNHNNVEEFKDITLSVYSPNKAETVISQVIDTTNSNIFKLNDSYEVEISLAKKLKAIDNANASPNNPEVANNLKAVDNANASPNNPEVANNLEVADIANNPEVANNLEVADIANNFEVADNANFSPINLEPHLSEALHKMYMQYDLYIQEMGFMNLNLNRFNYKNCIIEILGNRTQEYHMTLKCVQDYIDNMYMLINQYNLYKELESFLKNKEVDIDIVSEDICGEVIKIILDLITLF